MGKEILILIGVVLFCVAATVLAVWFACAWGIVKMCELIMMLL